jgi:hypothetical protein
VHQHPPAGAALRRAAARAGRGGGGDEGVGAVEVRGEVRRLLVVHRHGEPGPRARHAHAPRVGEGGEHVGDAQGVERGRALGAVLPPDEEPLQHLCHPSRRAEIHL